MDLIPHPLMARPGRRYGGMGRFSLPHLPIQHLKPTLSHNPQQPGPGAPLALHPMLNSPYGLLGGGMGMGMGMGMGGGLPGGLAMDPLGLLGMGGMGMGLGMGIGLGRGRRGLRDGPYGRGYGGRGHRYLDPYDLFDDVFDDEYLDDIDDIEDPLLLYLRLNGMGRRRGRRGRYGGMGIY